MHYFNICFYEYVIKEEMTPLILAEMLGKTEFVDFLQVPFINMNLDCNKYLKLYPTYT